MSLALDDTASPALRPPAPSRVKRYSSISPSPSLERTNHAERVVGVLGGLRERSEDELQRADAEDLRNALRAVWEEQDLYRSQLEQLEASSSSLHADKSAAEAGLQLLQNRLNDSLNEQTRLEADLGGRDELLERLRGRVNEAERTARVCTKRALEQERSFDAERQALQAQESHLQQRIRGLLSARPAQPSIADQRTLSDMQEELSTLNVSHSTLLAQLNTLTKEVHDLRATNATLQEENEGWEFLLRERTLSGKVREGGLLGYREDVLRIAETGPGQLDVLDEELEMDELHSDLEAQSPILEDDQGFIRDLDGSKALSRSPDSIHLKPPARSRPKTSKSKDQPTPGVGIDLAAELGRADVSLDDKDTPISQKDDTTEALRAEMKTLREENKALTLYCSKIIDRIIAQEGFEHILSVDYKTRRMGSRSSSSTGRGNLQDITNAMQAGNVPAEPAPVQTEKKARPMSMLGRAMSFQVEKPAEKIPKEIATPEVKETKTKKRARRGFSLDFRALGFGSSPTITTPTSESNSSAALKPLTLPARSTPVTAPSKAVLGRRLDKHEEDEEDRRERHRLEATLKLMGVDRQSSFSNNPPRVLPTTSKLVKAQLKSPINEERESLISPRPVSPNRSQHGTPLTRLSSALGSSESPQPLSPEYTGDLRLSPELAAAAALKAFDEKEAEKAKALSKGQGSGEYTSPTPGLLKRTGRRSTSGHTSRSPSNDRDLDTQVANEQQKIKASTSISTLWSMGSSRPNS